MANLPEGSDVYELLRKKAEEIQKELLQHVTVTNKKTIFRD
jgi:hypothetical protein